MKVLRIIWNGLKLCARLAMGLPMLMIRRHIGVRAFRKQLLKMGLQADIVRELSASYNELGKIHSWIPVKVKESHQ
ncbi:MAG TPA: hypothetical protein PK830_06160 [Candidatus Atribacteria bacterium]|nr:hypothetical protein [Candidatus Atribacteria bacterium]HPT78667.1 hypothetical protein [Candidatus Atribacteria bacterium]